jgi:type IV pilus assembly protein PilE
MRGFTLLELCIALAIVGILASFALPAYQSYRIRALDLDAELSLRQYGVLQERWRLSKGRYATAGQLLTQRPLPPVLKTHFTLHDANSAAGNRPSHAFHLILEPLPASSFGPKLATLTLDQNGVLVSSKQSGHS